MSTASTLGVLPRMLPVTGTYLAPFALANALLSLSVVRARIGTETFFETSTKPAGSKVQLTDNASNIDPVLLTTRLHGNFLENVPFALAIAAIVELNGGNRKVLTGVLGGLLFARVSHIVGLSAGIPLARITGFFGSLGIITGLGGYAAYLSKGYWGL